MWELILPAEKALLPDGDGCQHSILDVQQLQPIVKKKRKDIDLCLYLFITMFSGWPLLKTCLKKKHYLHIKLVCCLCGGLSLLTSIHTSLSNILYLNFYSDFIIVSFYRINKKQPYFWQQHSSWFILVCGVMWSKPISGTCLTTLMALLKSCMWEDDRFCHPEIVTHVDKVTRPYSLGSIEYHALPSPTLRWPVA